MSTVASTLLDFILALFRDPEKAAAYQADPRGALDAAGLSDTTPAEVAALVPMVTDYATVGGWSGDAGHHGHGDRDGSDEGGYDREGGRGRDCDGEGGYHPRPLDDEDEDRSGGGLAPVDREEREVLEEASSGGGQHHHAPAPAGGTETVVITHLQEIHHTHNETTVEIDASHSIWVSGDAQAIFGDVEGDVTQIDNEGGIVAGDDVEDSSVDNSDNSVRDSYNTDVDVDVEDSPINVGGNQAVDSFNEDNDGLDVENAEHSFNGNGSHNEDNDVVADRGGQVGDNTSVQVDDVTVVEDSANVGNTTTVTDSFNDESDNSTTTDVDVDVEDSFNEDHSVNDSYNDNSTATEVAVEDSYNDNSTTSDVDVELEDSFNDNSTNTEVNFEDAFNDNSDNSTATDVHAETEIEESFNEVGAGNDASVD